MELRPWEWDRLMAFRISLCEACLLECGYTLKSISRNGSRYYRGQRGIVRVSSHKSACHFRDTALNVDVSDDPEWKRRMKRFCKHLLPTGRFYKIVHPKAKDVLEAVYGKGFLCESQKGGSP